MNSVKMIAKRILYPPRWVLYIISPAVLAALAMIFVLGWDDFAPAYVLYYSLLVWALAAPGFYRRLRSAFLNNGTVRCVLDSAFGRRYRSDAFFRGRVDRCDIDRHGHAPAQQKAQHMMEIQKTWNDVNFPLDTLRSKRYALSSDLIG
jgi:hypothetical protein